MANTRLEYLFMRHYEKTATPQEKEELLSMIQDEAHAAELTRLVDEALRRREPAFELEDEKAGAILSSILQTGSDIGEYNTISVAPAARRSKKWYYAAAAAILLLGLGGAYRWLQQPARITPQAATSPVAKKDVAPGTNKAILTLADGSTITLDDAHNGALAQQGNVQVIKQDSGQLAYRPINGNQNNSLQYNTIATPRGGQYQVVLPDGTKAWLNASSSLKYPTAFTGKNRTVVLTGEGYFEVAKNEQQPFLVQVQGVNVEVLGTHFNIMAYPDENAIKTTLLEGAVKVSKGGASALLAPGQQASIGQDGARFITKTVDVEEDIAWKNGYIQFSDATLPAIMRQVSRWYDVEVSYANAIPQKEFAGKVPRTVPLSQLLNMLQYTGLQFKVEGNRITVIN